MKTLITSLLILSSSPSFARPQYAAKEKINCIQCHVNPWGAGARRAFGKIYGARDLSDSTHLESDWYYLDVRAVFSSMNKNTTTQASSQKTNQGNKKRGMMTSQAFLKHNFFEDYTVALNYDFGMFNSKIRETYFLMEKESYTLLLGQFYLPFGLLTDEHRTYTKMITASGLRDYEKGAVLTKTICEHFIADIGIFKGFNSLNQQEGKPGFIANFRLFPEDLPLLGGLSYLHHTGDTISPKAFSVYGVYDLNKYFDATLSFEYVIASNFNDININSRYIPRIIPSNLFGTYAQDVKGKVAHASQVEFRYELTPQFILLYKFDYLVLDQTKRDQLFTRNGFGFRYQPFHNFMILAKYEFNNISLPSYVKSDVYTVTESEGPILMLRAWY